MRFCLEKKKKKKERKELSTESNLGPLILRDIGQYAYNSVGVSADTLKWPGENTGSCDEAHIRIVEGSVE